jgi:acyl carrier protein
MLSSLSGIYGSVGQSNYAAGCSFQDALARTRTAAGFRGSVSLDLGWMRTIGIIAEKEEYRRNRESARDMAPVEAEDFIAVLEHYCDPSLPPLSIEKTQLLVGAVTPAHFHARGEEVVPTVARPLFAGFNVASVFAATQGRHAAGAAAQEDTALLFQQASGAKERGAIVIDAFKAKVARALGVAADEIDPTKKPSDYGVDSLMAVELRNWIRKDFRAAVAVFEMMGGVTITEVGELVTSRAAE